MIDLKIFVNFFSKLSKREQTICYLAVIFISAVLIDRLIIDPIASKIISLNKEVIEKKAAIRRNIRILNQKDRIISERKKYKSFLSKFQYGKEDATSLLKELEKMANDSSVYLVDIKPDGFKEVEGSDGKYMIKLNCEAQMEHIIRFMYTIETSDRLFSVEGYKITPKSKESSVATCNMVVAKNIIK